MAERNPGKGSSLGSSNQSLNSPSSSFQIEHSLPPLLSSWNAFDFTTKVGRKGSLKQFPYHCIWCQIMCYTFTTRKVHKKVVLCSSYAIYVRANPQYFSCYNNLNMKKDNIQVQSDKTFLAFCLPGKKFSIFGLVTIE